MELYQSSEGNPGKEWTNTFYMYSKGTRLISYPGQTIIIFTLKGLLTIHFQRIGILFFVNIEKK